MRPEDDLTVGMFMNVVAGIIILVFIVKSCCG